MSSLVLSMSFFAERADALPAPEKPRWRLGRHPRTVPEIEGAIVLSYDLLPKQVAAESRGAEFTGLLRCAGALHHSDAAAGPAGFHDAL